MAVPITVKIPEPITAPIRTRERDRTRVLLSCRSGASQSVISLSMTCRQKVGLPREAPLPWSNEFLTRNPPSLTRKTNPRTQKRQGQAAHRGGVLLQRSRLPRASFLVSASLLRADSRAVSAGFLGLGFLACRALGLLASSFSSFFVFA